MPRTENYYEILGVSRNATQEEIKVAFRRLAREYHPDVNPSPYAEERFKKINEAYNVLKDPSKRREYDNLLDLQEISRRAQIEDETPYYHPPAVPHIACSKCGAHNPSLRGSVFFIVISWFVVTYKIPRVDILCEKCRLKRGLLYNFITIFLGWWGFPWGFIYTIYALIVNLFGGEKPARNNDLLLLLLAYDFTLSGRFLDAYRCINESVQIGGSSKEKEDLLNYLKLRISQPIYPTKSYKKLIVSVLAVSILIALIGLPFKLCSCTKNYPQGEKNTSSTSK